MKKEMLNYNNPQLEIIYKDSRGLIISGDFEHIPHNACYAKIIMLFPFVDSNGNYRKAMASYVLYVGKTYDINEILNNLENDLDTFVIIDNNKIYEHDLVYYQKCHYEKLVSTNPSIYLMAKDDCVFENYDDMVHRIKLIYEAYQSIKITDNISQNNNKHL